MKSLQNLRDIETPNGRVYIKANRHMYSLPQAGLLANKEVEKFLNKHGYWQSKLVQGLWKHDTQSIQFTLVIDNFGVKYTQREDIGHLKTVLDTNYKITTDWTGTRYMGITLDWDY